MVRSWLCITCESGSLEVSPRSATFRGTSPELNWTISSDEMLGISWTRFKRSTYRLTFHTKVGTTHIADYIYPNHLVEIARMVGQLSLVSEQAALDEILTSDVRIGRLSVSIDRIVLGEQTISRAEVRGVTSEHVHDERFEVAIHVGNGEVASSLELSLENTLQAMRLFGCFEGNDSHTSSGQAFQQAGQGGIIAQGRRVLDMPKRDIRLIQNDIIRLRYEYGRASQSGNAASAEKLGESLIRYQVELYVSYLAADPGNVDIERLRQYYARALEREFGDLIGRRPNTCWVCSADVSDEHNAKCNHCRWWVCICGACKCPDFWNGYRKYGMECMEQRKRLGESMYQRLVDVRESKYPPSNYMSADVPF